LEKYFILGCTYAYFWFVQLLVVILIKCKLKSSNRTNSYPLEIIVYPNNKCRD